MAAKSVYNTITIIMKILQRNMDSDISTQVPHTTQEVTGLSRAKSNHEKGDEESEGSLHKSIDGPVMFESNASRQQTSIS